MAIGWLRILIGVSCSTSHLYDPGTTTRHFVGGGGAVEGTDGRNAEARRIAKQDLGGDLGSIGHIRLSNLSRSLDVDE